MCKENKGTQSCAQTSCMVKKYNRSCNESTTKLRSCNDMRAATQLKNFWTATGASCSFSGMRGSHRLLKVWKSDAQRGSHLSEDGWELQGHIHRKCVIMHHRDSPHLLPNLCHTTPHTQNQIRHKRWPWDCTQKNHFWTKCFIYKRWAGLE